MLFGLFGKAKRRPTTSWVPGKDSRPRVDEPPTDSEAGGGAEEMVQRVLNEYGQDLPEDRQIAGAIDEGISLANNGDWEPATEKFRQAIAEQPDYDVPHVWLADCIKLKSGAFEAVDSLMGAAKVCRRKSNLLAKAAELSLLEQPWRGTGDFIELFAQAIGALTAKPGRMAFGKHRPFLFWREICEAFDDGQGVEWVSRVITGSSLNDDMRTQIHRAIGSDPNYARSTFIACKVSLLREALAKRFPA